MKRLFFALWPEPKIRDTCYQLGQSLLPAGQPVRASNLHVTLLFLGSVKPNIEHALLQQAASISAAPISLHFDRLNYWRKPQIVCLSTDQWPGHLDQLVINLQQLANQQGLQTDSRPYRPHVTLLRQAHSFAIQPTANITWHSAHFCLLQSLLTPDGIVYRTLASWPLHES